MKQSEGDALFAWCMVLFGAALFLWCFLKCLEERRRSFSRQTIRSRRRRAQQQVTNDSMDIESNAPATIQIRCSERQLESSNVAPAA